MAIFGAGSMWDGTDEQKQEFFESNNYVIGWDYAEARDVYFALSSLKVGDIIYLKSNQPGSRTIRVKGIGLVTKPLIDKLFNSMYGKDNITDIDPVIEVKWVNKEEFHITIPETEGRLTNIRAATFFEEYLPYVQDEILNKIFSSIEIQ